MYGPFNCFKCGQLVVGDNLQCEDCKNPMREYDEDELDECDLCGGCFGRHSSDCPRNYVNQNRAIDGFD